MAPPNLELTFRDGGTGDAGDPYTGLDRFGRLAETLWQVPGSGDARVQSGYGRNWVGGVVWRRDEAAHAQSVDTEDNYYWYDALQQVKERQRGNLTGTPSNYIGIDNLQQEESWGYDATGNWKGYEATNPANEQTRTHNEANEITEIAPVPSGTPVKPDYDPDPVGNMLTLPKEPGISTAQYDLQWDAWNRLVAVRDGSTLVAGYTYDGLTRRLTKTNASETRHYYYSKDWRALEERVEGGTYLVDRQYTWGLRDRWDLLRRKRSVSGLLDEALYVLRDYLDPVAIADDSGDVVERYAYDAFGKVRVLAPDYSARSASDFAWDFLFHAEFQDADTGLYNYGYRYYDLSLGRWVNRDRIGERDGSNLYTMCWNEPIDKFDLFGMEVDSYPGEHPIEYTFSDIETGDPDVPFAAGLTIANWAVTVKIAKTDLKCCLQIDAHLDVKIKVKQLDQSVEAHERTHEEKWVSVWKDMAKELGPLDGKCYPNSKLATACSYLAAAISNLARAEGNLQNRQFDIDAYNHPGGIAKIKAEYDAALKYYLSVNSKYGASCSRDW